MQNARLVLLSLVLCLCPALSAEAGNRTVKWTLFVQARGVMPALVHVDADSPLDQDRGFSLLFPSPWRCSYATTRNGPATRVNCKNGTPDQQEACRGTAKFLKNIFMKDLKCSVGDATVTTGANCDGTQRGDKDTALIYLSHPSHASMMVALNCETL